MGMLLSRHYANNNTANGATKAVAPKPEEKVVAEETKITAEDINKMNGAKLRKLAKENGIQDPEDLTVGELKAVLCEKYS